jgi:hypothetical protein
MTSFTFNHKQDKSVSLSLQEMCKLLKSGENGVIDFGEIARENFLTAILL